MAINTFLKLTGPEIAGSSTIKGRETHIEVITFNYSCHQTVNPVRSASGGGTVEKVHHGPITFSKELDTASDDLLKMCWSGQHIDNGEFSMYRSSGDVGATNQAVKYLTIEIESIVVQDYAISLSAGGVPIENIAFNFAKITFSYDPQDITQGVPGGVQVISHDDRTNVTA